MVFKFSTKYVGVYAVMTADLGFLMRMTDIIVIVNEYSKELELIVISKFWYKIVIELEIQVTFALYYRNNGNWTLMKFRRQIWISFLNVAPLV